MQARRAAARPWQSYARGALASGALLAAAWGCDLVEVAPGLEEWLRGAGALAGIAPALAGAARGLRTRFFGREALIACAAGFAAAGGDLYGSAVLAFLSSAGEAMARYAEGRVLVALGQSALESSAGPGSDAAAAATPALGVTDLPGLDQIGPAALVAAVAFGIGAAVIGVPWSLALRRSAILLLAVALLPVAAEVIFGLAMTAAAVRGVQMRGARPLKHLARARALVLDESRGPLLHRAEVTDVVLSPTTVGATISPATALAVAAGLSRRVDPPLAEAIQRHVARMGIAPREVEHVHSIPGGAAARVEGSTVFVGSLELFRDRLSVPLDALGRDVQRLQAQGKRLVVIGDLQAAWMGIAVSARPVPGAVEAVRRSAVPTVAILAPESDAAKPLADQLGAQVHFARTAEERRRRLRAIGGSGGHVAVVARASAQALAPGAVSPGVVAPGVVAPGAVSVVFGAAALPAPLEGSDVAFLSDDLSLLPWLLDLARSARAILAQNVVLALALLGGLVAAALGGDLGVAQAASWYAVGRVILTVNALRVRA